VQGHSPEQRVTVGKKRNVKIKELKPVGNYAVRIVFDDGHDTGLYAWSYLQTLDRERDKRWANICHLWRRRGFGRGEAFQSVTASKKRLPALGDWQWAGGVPIRGISRRSTSRPTARKRFGPE
jgi:hypothetical protein